MNKKYLTILALACAMGAAHAGGLSLQPAAHSAYAADAAILGVAHAGKRIVGVGDYGVVLLSDDQGKTFRQAHAVPVSSTLTGVSFADERNGWAVGHWGVILRTSDGGENWTLQRSDTQEDRPLFSVHFFDDKEGIAVGLWSLVLVTRDGGANWQPLSLPAPPDGGKADRNLLSAFSDARGSLYVAAERGVVLRSDDRGRSWHYQDTGYKGSFWTGVALRSGAVLVGGLRGSLYRSADGGSHWQAIDSGIKSSITGMVERADGVVEAVGLDGAMLESRDGGQTFKARQRDDRLSLTGVIGAGNDVLRFSKRGIAAR